MLHPNRIALPTSITTARQVLTDAPPDSRPEIPGLFCFPDGPTTPVSRPKCNQFRGRTRNDLRFGLRVLLKQPGFTIVALLGPPLGIGATPAVFSLIEGVLLPLPPYREANRLVLV